MMNLELLDALAAFGTAQLSDAVGRTGAAGGFTIWGGDPRRALRGVARTAVVVPGGNRELHEMLPTVRPGDVLVVDAGGHVDRAIAGGLMALALRERGAVGLVVNGAIRDTGQLRELGWPVLARGVSPLGPHKQPGGAIDVPIRIGELAVEPGDAIIADADGVVAIAADALATALAAARAIAASEDEWAARVLRGEGLPRLT